MVYCFEVFDLMQSKIVISAGRPLVLHLYEIVKSKKQTNNESETMSETMSQNRSKSLLSLILCSVKVK